jgi:hypothetical protein
LDESEHMRSLFAASSGSNTSSNAIRRPMNLGALLIVFLRLYVNSLCSSDNTILKHTHTHTQIRRTIRSFETWYLTSSSHVKQTFRGVLENDSNHIIIIIQDIITYRIKTRNKYNTISWTLLFFQTQTVANADGRTTDAAISKSQNSTVQSRQSRVVS